MHDFGNPLGCSRLQIIIKLKCIENKSLHYIDKRGTCGRDDVLSGLVLCKSIGFSVLVHILQIVDAYLTSANINITPQIQHVRPWVCEGQSIFWDSVHLLHKASWIQILHEIVLLHICGYYVWQHLRNHRHLHFDSSVQGKFMWELLEYSTCILLRGWWKYVGKILLQYSYSSQEIWVGVEKIDYYDCS